MLTPTEETGLKQILNDFSDSDLFSLADTVTKKLLYVSERKAAIQTILSCLEKPLDLLKRQKITKKVLFSYLLKMKSFVNPESTKHDLIMMCLREWHSIHDGTSEHESSAEATEAHSSDIQNNFDWLNEMGTQFATWFFPMYNALEDFGPEHFWTDCKLIGELKTAKDTKEATVVGASDVVNFLISLVVNDKFYFDANSSPEYITSEQDPHGLVRILVSGVVHQMSNCIGLFDSFFGLVRNPKYNDNWKIKWIHLKIHVNSATAGNLAPICPLATICQ